MADGFASTEKVTAAVVTGRHPFDVPGFHRLFRSMAGVDAYVQHMEDFVSDAGNVAGQYDVVLFYNMHRETPGGETLWWEKRTREAFERLGQSEQGIVVLHHAVLAWPDWPLWSEIVGIPDRSFDSYHIGETVRIEVADADHPITRGLTTWEMVDETYAMNDAGEGNRILLTTDHPKSARTIAWTRRYNNAAVFCLQSGHDNRAWGEPDFRTVLERGILWCAGRI